MSDKKTTLSILPTDLFCHRLKALDEHSSGSKMQSVAILSSDAELVVSMVARFNAFEPGGAIESTLVDLLGEGTQTDVLIEALRGEVS